MQRFIEVLSQINNDPDFTKEEKIEIINRAFENYRNQIDNDYKNYAAKQYLGAILEIGAAGLPMGGAGKLGVQYIGKPLTKYIGRKIAQNIGSGIAAGGASAGLFGVGNGLINEKKSYFYRLAGNTRRDGFWWRSRRNCRKTGTTEPSQ